MKIAIFTGYRYVNYFKGIFKKYSHIIEVNYLYESHTIIPKSDESSLIVEKGEKYEFLYERNYELVIVYGWNYIFPSSIINKIDFYNIHTSLLPKYRGPIPLVFQLLNNEIIGGVTLHKIDKNIDSGDIYKQYTYKINENESHISLNIKIMRGINYLLNSFITDYFNNELILIKQNNAEATYFTFGDLDKYILDNKYTYEEFYRIVKIFNGLPIKIKTEQDVNILKSFSLEKISNDYCAFQLLDRKIFILV